MDALKKSSSVSSPIKKIAFTWDCVEEKKQDVVDRHVIQITMAKWKNIHKLCIWDGIHTEEKMN